MRFKRRRKKESKMIWNLNLLDLRKLWTPYWGLKSINLSWWFAVTNWNSIWDKSTSWMVLLKLSRNRVKLRKTVGIKRLYTTLKNGSRLWISSQLYKMLKKSMILFPRLRKIKIFTIKKKAARKMISWYWQPNILWTMYLGQYPRQNSTWRLKELKI